MKLTAPPKFNLEHIQLERFESLVYRRRYDEASEALMELLRRLRVGSEFVGMPREGDVTREGYYGRLSAAITSLFADPRFTVSDEGYAKLLIEHALLDAIYEVGCFGSSDYVARILSDQPTEQDPAKLTYSTENLAKWLILHGLNSSIEINSEELYGRAPQLAKMFLPLWAAHQAHAVVLTEKSHARRESIIGMGRYFAGLDKVPDVAVPPLSDAYMNASYCVRPDKHAVKRVIANLFARTLGAALELPTAEELEERRSRTPGRPTIMVPLENFGSFHAMYRCYAPILRQLRKKFRLVACARTAAVDDTSRLLFDDLVPLPPGQLVFSDIVEAVDRVKPDILYYPSLGMAMQWVALSCVRLAPIQVMTLGHPATSESPAMDYVIAEDIVVKDATVFSETVLTTPNGAMVFERRPDLPSRMYHDAKWATNDGRVIDIAVAGMVLKLNYPYLKMLKEIARRCLEEHTQAVRFNFFPSLLGLGHFLAKKQLRAVFPNCVVHDRVEYIPYMEHLYACDLALCPYPFGGTNTTLDYLWCDLPTVMLRGDQPHSRSDEQILRHAPYLGCVTATEDIYIQRAVDFATQPLMRRRCSQALEAVDLEKLFFEPDPTVAEDAYLSAFLYIYTHHEDIKAEQQEKKRVIPHYEYNRRA